MLHAALTSAVGGLVASALIGGCASPMNDLSSAVQMERSIRHKWTLPDASGERHTQNSNAAPEVDSYERPEIGPDSSLAECVRYALLESPRVESAFMRWRAALERVPQVTALPEPRASYGYFINEVETRVGPQRHRFGISQTLPWFGRLDLRGDAAAVAADAQFERLQAVTLVLINDVRDAYHELYYLRGAIALNRENMRLLEQFERIVRTRYKVGAGSHPDLIRLQVELGKLEDQVRELEQRRAPLVARFNAALDRPADAAAPWPDVLEAADVELDHDRLATALRQRNPELAALTRELDRHRVEAEIARNEAFPDITIMFDYIVTDDAVNPSIAESGDDATIVGASVTLPIWREKYDAAIRESLKQRLATATARDDRSNQLIAALEEALFRHEDAVRRVELFDKTLIPKAKESLEATLGAYQTAEASFTDLLDAERVLLEMQFAERRARADAANALATIDRLTGSSIFTTDADTSTTTENTP
jgi:outer membrane protein TolC